MEDEGTGGATVQASALEGAAWLTEDEHEFAEAVAGPEVDLVAAE